MSVELFVEQDVATVLSLVIPAVLAGVFMGIAAISAWLAWKLER